MITVKDKLGYLRLKDSGTFSETELLDVFCYDDLEYYEDSVRKLLLEYLKPSTIFVSLDEALEGRESDFVLKIKGRVGKEGYERLLIKHLPSIVSVLKRMKSALFWGEDSMDSIMRENFKDTIISVVDVSLTGDTLKKAVLIVEDGYLEGTIC